MALRVASPHSDGVAADLRFGRWQNVLSGVECDACIFDAPYSDRVHSKHNAGLRRRADKTEAKAITYDAFSAADVHETVTSWSPRTRGWICSITSHDLVPVWESEFDRVGRYVFPPVPIVDRGMSARRAGDGPASWTVFMVVARPKRSSMIGWGALPGVYERDSGDPRSERMGGKPLGVMRKIVSDYSRPGDLVCDPFAGHATTLLAALLEGRRAVGAEVDRDAYMAGRSRLSEVPIAPSRDGTLPLF